MSVRGPGGGIQTRGAASIISIGEVIRAVDRVGGRPAFVKACLIVRVVFVV